MKKSTAIYQLLQMYRANTVHASSVLKAKMRFIEVFNAGILDRDLHDCLGDVNFKTLERWNGELKAAGDDPDAFERPARSDKHSTSVTKEEADILFFYALRTSRPPVAEAVRQSIEAMSLVGIEPKSTRTYVRFINKFIEENYDIWVMSREGKKALNDKVSNYVSRDYDTIEVGDILVADGHVLNFTIMNPLTGKPKRMTMVLFLDMKSSMPLGFEIMPTENHICVASALRRSIMLLQFKPRVLYFDNGRAFKNKIFMKQPLHTGELPGLFARLKIEVMNAESYHGQSKTIEPWWRNIAELERMMSSYSGINIEKKPAYLMRNEKLHKSVHERLTDGIAPSIDEVYQYFISFFRSWEQRPHQSGIYAGRTPAEIFAESLEVVKARDDYQQRIIEPRELDLLMLNETMRTTQRERIRLFGREYEHPNLYGLRKKLLVKYDFLNHSEILVYTLDNELVCVAKRVDVVHPAARLIGSHNDVLKLEQELATKRTNMALTVDQFREYTDNNDYISQRRLETQITPIVNLLPVPAPVDDQEEQQLLEQKKQALQLAANASPAAAKRNTSPSLWSDMSADASPEDYIINKEAL